MTGSRIFQLMRGDHERLDGVLRGATAGERMDVVAFQPFRSGLLRHIGIEEKILIPFLRARRAEGLEFMRQLKLDHAALVALLVPTPTLPIVRQLAALLVQHNALEEGKGGLYELCAEAAGTDEEALLKRAETAPAVPLAPHNDAPRAFANIERLFRAAGRSPT